MSFYVQLEEAREKLLSRHSLRSAVVGWWGEKGFQFPQAFLEKKPLGFISRHLATARYEDLKFIWLCGQAGLSPIWSTYNGDKFIDRSPVKYSYLQPRVVTDFGKNGSPIVRRWRLAEPKQWEGKSLDSVMITTEKYWIPLVGRHKSWLLGIYPAVITDFTQIYRACGRAKDYYPLLLSLAVAHGVMFEDFHGGESSGVELGSFTQRVFEPAFREVQEYFGVKPLIVPLPWWKELGYYLSPEPSQVRTWRTHPVLKEYRG